MTRSVITLLLAAWLVAIVAATGPAPRQATDQDSNEVSGPISAIRRAEMQRHFGQASAVYDAVIRGDLDTAREEALALWSMPAPAGVAAAGAPFLDAIRMQGRRVSEASTVAQAAESVAGMLATCGDCHRVVGVGVVAYVPQRPVVGGIVGHMLEHEQAVTQMAEGLIAPSTTRWEAGARALTAAPLDHDELPPDSDLTPAVRSAESRVHAIAEQALTARDTDARVDVFANILATCSNCHSLHSRIWGPGR